MGWSTVHLEGHLLGGIYPMQFHVHLHTIKQLNDYVWYPPLFIEVQSLLFMVESHEVSIGFLRTFYR